MSAQSGRLRFLPALLRSVSFGATPAGQRTLDAVRHLRGTDGGVGSLGYRLCLLDAMRIGTRRRDLFTTPSLR